MAMNPSLSVAEIKARFIDRHQNCSCLASLDHLDLSSEEDPHPPKAIGGHILLQDQVTNYWGQRPAFLGSDSNNSGDGFLSSQRL